LVSGKRNRPLVIGLTGGVGCGKTAVAEVFALNGALIISGDETGHDVVDRNKSLQRKLAQRFGEDILVADGINRRKLASRAFADPEGTRQLNELVHPALVRELTRRVSAARGKSRLPAVVVDAALLVEWEMKVPVDILVVVWASRANRRRWLKKRGWADREITDRMQAQLPYASVAAAADFILRNDGDLGNLRRKAERLWQKLFDHH